MQQNQTWAERVLAYRAAAQISQVELARRMGVSRFTVIRWEAGTSQPERRHIHALQALERTAP